MRRALLVLILACPLFAAKSILIVSDGVPTQILAVQLKSRGIDSEIVSADRIPAKLSAYPAVIVYLRDVLADAAEKAFIAYANSGGRLIALDQSISSQKRKNPAWLNFLGVSLPEGDAAHGGYRFFSGVNVTIVNLAPDNWITTHEVHYDERTQYRGADREALELPATGIYVNQLLDGPRTVLLGLKFRDEKTGASFEQDIAGWYKKTGKGSVMYFMPGHNGREFEEPAYAQILANAVSARSLP